MSLYNTVKTYNNFTKHPFDQYDENGSTIVAIAGDNYVVIGADTRLISRTTILSRHQEKLVKLSPSAVFAASGCWADALTFYKVLKTRVDMYVYDNHRPIATTALAQLVATTLYYRRFLPYGIVSMIAGMDEEGKGCVYIFDAVGHCETSMFAAAGRSGSLLQPLLDNQLGNKPPVSDEKAISLIRDGFMCAAEREVASGDSLQIFTIKRGEKITEKRFALRRD